jgi:hypothetical protein
MRILLALSLAIVLPALSKAQSAYTISPAIKLNDTMTGKITPLLDTLLVQIRENRIAPALLEQKEAALSKAILSSLKGMEDKDSLPGFYKIQLLNLYPVGSGRYLLSLAYTACSPGGTPVIRTIFSLSAVVRNGAPLFSLPLQYLTRNWKTKTVGRVIYHYPDTIHLRRANAFNTKNTLMAGKLGLPPEQLHFYLCANYQEALQLMGYTYDQGAAGKTRDGYGVEANTIFATMGNEDFSHDLFHFYAEKIRTSKRNSAAEEGIAYSWGNAYYTSTKGEMISQRELMPDLRKYLAQHPDASLLELFSKNVRGFSLLAREASIRSTIASLLSDEVEKRRGIAGIKQLINCGGGDDNYFIRLNELIGVNRTNFNEKVLALINAYQ